MKVPIAMVALAVSMLMLIYFSASIFNEVDNTINVTGTDYEGAYNTTHNVTSMSFSIMNYMSLLLFLLVLIAIMAGFYKLM